MAPKNPKVASLALELLLDVGCEYAQRMEDGEDIDPTACDDWQECVYRLFLAYGYNEVTAAWMMMNPGAEAPTLEFSPDELM